MQQNYQKRHTFIGKKAGRPHNKDNPLYKARKEAKQNLRKLQRQQSALERMKLYNEITQASIETDQKLFYTLVNKQRQKSLDKTSYIKINDKIYNDYDNIIDGWKTHFENLAQPKESTNFDDNHKSQVESNRVIIESICNSQNLNLPEVTENEIRKIISMLKNNKAPDPSGLTAEHFKFAIEEITPVLTNIINSILKSADIPKTLKTGVLTPILKKGKDKTLPGSYRGITVTSLIGKIIESYLQNLLDPILNTSQNKLQRGFTSGTSPLMAGLFISEAFYDAKDNKEPLILQTFDAEKAFDVVWHDDLLCKLFKDGIEGDLWKIITSLHVEANTMVKWDNKLSAQITLQQGIRQGAKLSSLMYKRFNNDLINTLQNVPEGVKLGNIDLTAPTCADDIALLSRNTRDSQILTNVIEITANKERFTINPTKSEILTFTTGAKKKQMNDVFYGGLIIKQVPVLKHLGIERNQTNTVDVKSRIDTARKTLYALFGSGMHGKNGLSPTITVQLWTTFVLPRLLHGIELLTIRKQDLEKLEIYQRKILKMLQTIPERTASAAALALVGAKPIESHIDTKIITTFLNITKDPTTAEHHLAIRQLKIKKEDSNSWFITAKKTLQKYNLPNPEYLLNSIRNEKDLKFWKNKAKTAINIYWQSKRENEYQNKTSLNLLKLQPNSCKKPHLIWCSSRDSPNATRKAIIKAQIASNTYMLQSIKNKHKQQNAHMHCQLCGDGDEDRKHFILHCPSLTNIRNPYIKNLNELLSSQIGNENTNRFTLNDEALLQLLVDCSENEFSFRKNKNLQIQRAVEGLARNLIYALHCERSKLIKALS